MDQPTGRIDNIELSGDWGKPGTPWQNKPTIEAILPPNANITSAPKYWKIKFNCSHIRLRRGSGVGSRRVPCNNTLTVAVPIAAMHSQAGYHIICPACGQTYAITEQGAVPTTPNKGIDVEGNPLK